MSKAGSNLQLVLVNNFGWELHLHRYTALHCTWDSLSHCIQYPHPPVEELWIPPPQKVKFFPPRKEDQSVDTLPPSEFIKRSRVQLSCPFRNSLFTYWLLKPFAKNACITTVQIIASLSPPQPFLIFFWETLSEKVWAGAGSEWGAWAIISLRL